MVKIVKCCCGVPLKYGSCLAFMAILFKGVATAFLGFIAALHQPIESVFEPTGFDKLRNTMYALFGICAMILSNFAFFGMVKKTTHGLTLCIYYLHFNSVCAVIRAIIMLFLPEMYDRFIAFNPLPPSTAEGIFVIFSKTYVCPLEIVLSVYFGIILHSYKAVMTAKASDSYPIIEGQQIRGIRYHPRVSRSLSDISEQTTPESEKEVVNTANVPPINGIRSHCVATQTNIDNTDSDDKQGSRNIPVLPHSAPCSYGIVLEKTPLSSPESNKSPVQIIQTPADIQSPDDDEREPSKSVEEIPKQVIHSDTSPSTSMKLLTEHDTVHSLCHKTTEYSNVEEHVLPSGSDGIPKKLIKSDTSQSTSIERLTACHSVYSSFEEVSESSDTRGHMLSSDSKGNESSAETLLTPADIQSPYDDEREPNKDFEEIPKQVIHSDTSQTTSMKLSTEHDTVHSLCHKTTEYSNVEEHALPSGSDGIPKELIKSGTPQSASIERLTASHSVYSSFEEVSVSSDTREHMLSSDSKGNESSMETLLTPADIQSPVGDEYERNKDFEGIPKHVIHSDGSQSTSTELLTPDNEVASSFTEVAQSSNVEQHELPSSSKEI